MDKTITKRLTELGLTETEATLYCIGLAAGKSIGVADIQKQTSIKRPTIYHALDTLAGKGMVAKILTEGHKNYIFSPPTQLKALAEVEVQKARTQLVNAVQMMPQLNRLHTEQEGTRVAHYEGIEGVKAVVESALNAKSSHWDIIAPRKNFFSEFDKDYAAYYLKTRKSRNITSRSLWELTAEGKQLSPGGKVLSKTELLERNPRYLPLVMRGTFSSTLIIFDDKVAIVSSIKSLSAILITSEEIHQFFLALFNGLWAVSSPYTE